METIKHHYPDFIKSSVGFIFILYFLYIKLDYNIINVAFLLEISFLERIIIFLIVSFFAGRLSFELGYFLSGIVRWFISSDENKYPIKEHLIYFIAGLTVKRRFEHDDGHLLKTETDSYIEKDFSLRKSKENIINEESFWETILGASFLSLFFSSDRFSVFVVLILSLIFSLIYRSRYFHFWKKCCTGLRREKSEQKKIPF